MSQCNEFDLVERSGRARALAGSSLDIFDQRMSPKRNEQWQSAVILVENRFCPQKSHCPKPCVVRRAQLWRPGTWGDSVVPAQGHVELVHNGRACFHCSPAIGMTSPPCDRIIDKNWSNCNDVVRSSRQVKVQCSTLSEICLLYGEYMYFIVHYTDAFLLTYIHTYKDTYICVRKRNRYNYHVVVPIYFVLKPYIHACIHTYIHTYIHTHIYIVYIHLHIFIYGEPSIVCIAAHCCRSSRPHFIPGQKLPWTLGTSSIL